MRVKDLIKVLDPEVKVEMFRIIGDDAGYYIGQAQNIPPECMELIVDYISAGKGDCSEAKIDNTLLLDCYDDPSFIKKQ